MKKSMVKIPYIVKNESPMNNSEHSVVMEAAPQTPNSTNLHDQASGPSSTDLSTRPPRDPAEEFLQRLQYSNAAPPAPPPVRALPPPPPQQPRTGMERAAGVLRVAIPFVQRLLPLLDGHVGTAVSNVLAHQQPKAPALPPAPPVNLVPLQEGLADLRVQQRALRDQVVEQNSSLKRVEDHLQAVREATDRNTLEQQELLEDLKSVGGKVNFFAYVAIALLFLSVIMNVVLFLQFRHIIP
jgi:hypothetical protein